MLYNNKYFLKATIFFVTLLVSCVFLFSKLCIKAVDNKSYYGDGNAATWEDIKPFLSPIYKNTPYISISNNATTQKFYFNVELFCDLGLCVYAEPNSVQFTGTVNDFKAVEGGYFKTTLNGKTIYGEYRFIGFSLNGTPITNSRFPSEVEINEKKAKLVKYSNLPQNVKKLFGVNNLNNSAYMPIKDLIECVDSPIWNFTTTVNGRQESLQERLTKMGLFKDGKSLLSLLDYGIFYSWAESGGVVRLFFASEMGSELFYSYATFTGPVSVDFIKQYPGLSSYLFIEGHHDYQVGENTFYIGASQESLSFNVALRGTMADNYKKLSDFARVYSFTRDQMTGYSIIIDNLAADKTKKSFFDNCIDFDGTLYNFSINKSDLSPGRNTIQINGVLKIRFGNAPNARYISAPCSLNICIIYEPYVSPATTPLPAPIASPEPTENFPSANTPSFEISRKW